MIRAITCLMKVMGLFPMAWASPMLALITDLNGFWTPFQFIITFEVLMFTFSFHRYLQILILSPAHLLLVAMDP